MISQSSEDGRLWEGTGLQNLVETHKAPHNPAHISLCLSE